MLSLQGVEMLCDGKILMYEEGKLGPLFVAKKFCVDFNSLPDKYSYLKIAVRVIQYNMLICSGHFRFILQFLILLTRCDWQTRKNIIDENHLLFPRGNRKEALATAYCNRLHFSITKLDKSSSKANNSSNYNNK